MWIIKILGLNLTIVLVVEMALAFLMGVRGSRKVATVALANVITNPAVVILSLLLTVYLYQWRIWWLLLLEVAAVGVEGYIFSRYKTFPKGNPYIISLVLNLSSFGIGEIVNVIF